MLDRLPYFLQIASPLIANIPGVVVKSMSMSESPPSAGQPNRPVAPLDRREVFEIAAERHKAELAEYGVDAQRSFESVRAANQSGAEAIKAATLINGGAAVAMLAFIGHLASIQAEAAVIMSFAKPLRLFVVGALLGVVASGVTYFSQSCYGLSLDREFRSKEAKWENKKDIAAKKHIASVRWRWAGKVINFLAVSAVVAALYCFAGGCCAAYRSFESGFTSAEPNSWTVF